MQLQSVEPSSPSGQALPSIPTELQDILSKFQDVFSPPTELPPERSGDHRIPLMEGAQPFCLRSYRYNPAQKTEIENQIKEMLARGWIQVSTRPFHPQLSWSARKLGIGDYAWIIVASMLLPPKTNIHYHLLKIS